MKTSRLSGLILRQSEPDNLEFPFSTLEGVVTPNEKFYIRNHFKVPAIDPRTWRLRIDGAVNRTLSLTLDDLKRLPRASHLSVLECSGNSRVFLSPKVEGLQWELGGVACARWTGARLADVLDRAGLSNTAREVIFEGADRGVPEKSLRPEKPIHFAHSLSVAEARRLGVLLAYEMNGEPLPVPHGAPLRLVVPGWYAMASVKWLGHIRISETPFQGYFQTVEYSHWQVRNGTGPERYPIGGLAVKSQIARPALYERVEAGKPYRIYGAAWSSVEIAKVDVSTDGGRRWSPARMLGEAAEHSWRLWEYLWQVPARRGPRILMSRATDVSGEVQPSKHNRDDEGYMIHHTLPIQVEIG